MALKGPEGSNTDYPLVGGRLDGAIFRCYTNNTPSGGIPEALEFEFRGERVRYEFAVDLNSDGLPTFIGFKLEGMGPIEAPFDPVR